MAQSRDLLKDQICSSSGRHRASGSGKTDSQVGPDASFSVDNLSQEKRFQTEFWVSWSHHSITDDTETSLVLNTQNRREDGVLSLMWRRLGLLTVTRTREGDVG